ncbi:MAG: hypothetical protein WBO04_16170 [Steroidobacteraceae bacterium]
MFRYVATLLFAFSAVALGDGISKVNGSIRIDDGQRAGNVSTVNGSVTIGRDAQVGDVDTVNGAVRLGQGATAAAVDTVNGSVSLDERVRVQGPVNTVNGQMNLQTGARVDGSLENVNGDISLRAAQVGGGIETVNGDVFVGTGSRVEGGIHIEENRSWFKQKPSRNPKVTVESGAVVRGPLHFEREVDLYLGADATVGTLEGVTPRMNKLP